MSIATAAIAPGFDDPTRASQSAFRAILDAFARPGCVVTLDHLSETPADLPPAAAITLLTLADYETPLWLPPSVGAATRRWLAFHTGAAETDDPAAAKFAVVQDADASHRLGAFDAGDDRYPDKSATVIVCCDALHAGAPVILSGPGIAGDVTVAPRGLDPQFWDDWAENHARFPLGVDVVLVAGASLLALPRSIAARPQAGGA